MISISAMVTAVIILIVAGVIFGVLWWLIGYCGLPEPFNKASRVVLAVLAALIVIGVLLSLIPGAPPIFKP